MLQLFDTARGQVRPLETREAGKVSMYVCGPTVYGPPHLGHGRFSLVFDVLRRYLEWSGLEVTYVSNITDIDDNIINRAEREDRDWTDIVHKCESVWYQAMDAIGVKRPDHDPHATAYVEEMVTLLEELVAAGAAYETDDGLYFAPQGVDDYGLLARQSLESLQSGARVDVDDSKRSPIDFALWKKSKPGEPAWPSPWGDGRPGWHTECVAMSLDILGPGFDIHGGGQDLAFPHHENERAQAVALGHTFAQHWVHNGFVEVNGEKMSKSLNNFTNLLDLIDHADPRAYRLLVLQAHYRSPVSVDDNTVAQAEASLDRLDSFARRAAGAEPGEQAGAEETELFGDAVSRFTAAMDNDLDTPEAMSIVFDLVRQGNTAVDGGDGATAAAAVAAVAELCGALGLVLDASESEVPEEVLALARARDEARAAKDFAAADAARDQLQEQGWTVEDTVDGTRVRRG